MDDLFSFIRHLPMSEQLLAINSKLKHLPIGAGNTNISLRQMLRVLRIANGDELRLKDIIRRTLMVDCLPNHLKFPINQVLGPPTGTSTSDHHRYEITDSQTHIRYAQIILFVCMIPLFFVIELMKSY